MEARPMVAAPVGQRIRARRQHLRLTQAALARQVGVSPSYLNLIERNRRSVGGSLLHRIAAALDLDSRALAGTEEARLIAELVEIGADPAIGELGLSTEEAREIVATSPGAARTMLSLYRACRNARQQADLLAERLGESSFLGAAGQQIVSLVTAIRSFSGILHDYGDLSENERSRFVERLADDSERLAMLASATFELVGGRGAHGLKPAPMEEVEDFFSDRANYFPALENAAALLRARLAGNGDIATPQLVHYLSEAHKIRAVRDPPTDPPAHGLLHLPAVLEPASLRFRLARAIAELEGAGLFERIMSSATFGSEDARRRCRRALANYFAAALLMPYDGFAAAARDCRHDIALIANRFEASFEQVCHRLATLRRPGAQGVPIHFLRVDLAGNISKRFSASGLRLPRYGGACPRWIVHAAFLTPGRIVRQVALLPDGQRYVFVACASLKAAPFGLPRTAHAVMIGCRASDARHFVYGDGLAMDGSVPAVPVGTSCSQCPREDCEQRAFDRVTLEPAPQGGIQGIRT
jgi:predicted transcriptional regulator/transcriptional regulator with XRE-family HTH domain